MLALSRRRGESLIIDGRIRVMVVGITSQGKVRLGIDAPPDVAVDREEVAIAKREGLATSQVREGGGR